MRNFSGKVVEKIKTHVLCSVRFPFFENRAIYEIMLQKYGRRRQTDRWRNTVAQIRCDLPAR